ncbi:MAG: hypothetical protein DWQ06_03975 [Calditrichaeota bacterium]|nr:MAG: hypothetical protein DWQ06_03975 [Calditrichota bacterium]
MKKITNSFLLFALIFSISCLDEDLGKSKPDIKQLYASKTFLEVNDTTKVFVVAEDPNSGTHLSYSWDKSGGFFTGKTDESEIIWQAPSVGGNYDITVTVENEGGKRRREIELTVFSMEEPEIEFANLKDNDFVSSAQKTFLIETNAFHSNGIEEINIFINNQLVSTCPAENCSFNWNVENLSGNFAIKVTAKSNSAGAPIGTKEINVSVEGTIWE